jgi:trehalose-6-phosphate synthase
MQLDERKDRWRAMMAVLRANSVHDWASQFLQGLTNEAEGMEFDNPLRRVGVRLPSMRACIS